MFTIEIMDDVPLPSDAESATMPPAVRRGVERYREAHRALYGVYPEVTWDGYYLRILGQPQGVTPGRLREMTQQLKWRAG